MRRTMLFWGASLLFIGALVLPIATSAGAATISVHGLKGSVSHSVTATNLAGLYTSSEFPATAQLVRAGVTPNAAISCTGITGISYQTTDMYSYGYIFACAGGTPALCSATVDLQEEPVGTSTWTTEVDGPTEYGCPPDEGISTITAGCHSTPHSFNYRTVGHYVIIADGTTSTKTSISPVRTVSAVCS